jgi:hypothetical protein
VKWIELPTSNWVARAVKRASKRCWEPQRAALG